MNDEKLLSLSTIKRMNEDKLIYLIHNNESLYNVNHPDYSNSAVKDRIWNEIGEEMELSVLACKQRWFNLRDQYRRTLKHKLSVDDGEALPKKKKWKHEDKLAFLKPFMQKKELLSTNIVEQTLEVRLQEEDDDSACVEKQKDNLMNLIADDSHQSKKSDSNSFLQYDNNNSMKKCNKIKNIETPIISHLNYDENDEVKTSKTALDSFLCAMGENIKTFPLIYQHKAKEKIFKVVSDIEKHLILVSENGENVHHRMSEVYDEDMVS
ncbi:hypothetical protein O3M35_002485 [Rhynocoris fuscipes]|uniref:MADF domain-containing protein n=1 Tax=Rhynocoris fuscipes TaxID=488301 RepID=A0AAW1CKI0_9HEMI